MEARVRNVCDKTIPIPIKSEWIRIILSSFVKRNTFRLDELCEQCVFYFRDLMYLTLSKCLKCCFQKSNHVTVIDFLFETLLLFCIFISKLTLDDMHNISYKSFLEIAITTTTSFHLSTNSVSSNKVTLSQFLTLLHLFWPTAIH